jgi:hypothetical protein
MKIIKGFSIFTVLFSFIILNSCINEPSFSEIPEISIKKVYFVVTPTVEEYDTLFVVLNFKDGDGNLGLPANNPYYVSDPFHEVNLYVEEGDPTKLKPITTYQGVISENKSITVIDPGGPSGKLVTLKTREKPGFEILPPYQQPFTKTAYTFGTFYVHKSNINSFYPELTPVDTIDDTYYGLEETFYTTPNENYYNIDVTFEVRKNDVYVPFDWTKTARITTPSTGRFPVLGGDDKRPLEGQLTYAIAYPDFLYDFKNTAIKLKIQIKDRALNKSNIVETDEFTIP